MIENAILVLEKQYFCCCLLHFINSYLGIYIKKKKKKQNKAQQANKTKKKQKREMEKRRSLAECEPGTFGLIRLHIATTPLRMIT